MALARLFLNAKDRMKGRDYFAFGSIVALFIFASEIALYAEWYRSKNRQLSNRQDDGGQHLKTIGAACGALAAIGSILVYFTNKMGTDEVDAIFRDLARAVIQARTEAADVREFLRLR